MSGRPCHTTCPRCGEPSGGVVWCAGCGLNLRIKEQEPADGEQPLAQPTRARPQPWPAMADELGSRPARRVVVATCAGVAVLAAVVLLVVALAGSGSTTSARPAPAAPRSAVDRGTVADATTIADDTGDVAPTPAEGEVLDVLDRYARAYSDEDTGRLARVFTSDLVRTDGSDTPVEGTAVLGVYQSQFDRLTDPDYALSDVTTTVDVGQASASARYAIASQETSATGAIAFHLVETADGLLIDQITTEPS